MLRRMVILNPPQADEESFTLISSNFEMFHSAQHDKKLVLRNFS